MLTQLMKSYEKGKSRKVKLIALCIRAVTGVIGGSLILSNEHPYLSIAVLAIGAVADEITKFISEEESDDNSDTPPPPAQ